MTKEEKRLYHRNYHKGYYQRNKDKYKAKTRAMYLKNWEFIKAAKERPCADCGNIFPFYVMDFDHREGETKIADVAALKRKKAWARMRKEIEKCDVVCSNCHRIRTFSRLSDSTVTHEMGGLA